MDARDHGSHLDLEALSATLDEPQDDAARAHLAACDTCRARRDDLAAAAAAVGAAPPPAPAAALERAVAAALAAVEAEAGADTSGAGRSPRPGDVVALTARPSRRAPVRAPVLVALAAVLALVALAVPIVAALRDPGGLDGDAASSGSGAESAGSEDSAAEEDGGLDRRAMASGAPGGDDLGAIDPRDLDGLWAAVDPRRATDDGAAAGEGGAGAAAPPCLDALDPPADAGDLVARATATVGGDPVAVYLLDTGRGGTAGTSRRLVVVALDGCRPLADDAR